jgi:molecular chaperone GrpE
MGQGDPNSQFIEPAATNGADARDGNQPQATGMSASAGAPEATASSQVVSLQEFKEVTERLDQLRESFNSKLLYDQAKDKQIDFLHGEVKQVRERLFHQTLRPLYLSLIKLHDLIGDGRKAELLGAGGETKTTRNYQTYQGEIEEILLGNGVSSYRTDAGKPVDRARHQVMEAVAATEPAQIGTISESLRPGFMYEINVLRTEWVKAYSNGAGN